MDINLLFEEVFPELQPKDYDLEGKFLMLKALAVFGRKSGTLHADMNTDMLRYSLASKRRKENDVPMTTYKILWDNGDNACGSFNVECATEAEAEALGSDWLAEMKDIDPDGEYAYEVIAYESSDDEYADLHNESTLSHFDRYIAGDR